MTRITGAMERLRAYLCENDVRQADFAAQVGTTQATISRLLNGVVRPGLDLAVAIEAATQGQVPVAAWVSGPAVTRNPAEDAA